jgi:hypothetical protein
MKDEKYYYPSKTAHHHPLLPNVVAGAISTLASGTRLGLQVGGFICTKHSQNLGKI